MNARRHAGDGEGGFTVIEVVVAMALSILSVGAVAMLMVHANDSSLGSQRQVNLLSIAQQQIEQVRQKVSQYGFSALAMNAYPATASDATLPLTPLDPNDFVTNDGTPSAALLIEKNYNQTAGGQVSSAPNNGEPLVGPVSGTDPSVAPQIVPRQTLVLAGTGTATVYTFVTQVPYVTQTTINGNPSLTGCSAACATLILYDARRVTVAVKLDQPGGRTDLGPNAPTYASTIITNPIPSSQPNAAIGLRVGLNVP